MSQATSSCLTGFEGVTHIYKVTSSDGFTWSDLYQLDSKSLGRDYLWTATNHYMGATKMLLDCNDNLFCGKPCDQIGRFLKVLDNQIFIQKYPKYVVTFCAI